MQTQAATRPLPDMPDHARLWVFAAPRPLQPREAERLLERVDAFVHGWRAHGVPVVGAYEWRYDRFLLVAADERATGVSGCSIDSLFHTLGEVEEQLGVPLRDAASRVWFRDSAGEIQSLSRPEFRARVAAGEVDGDTVVFDHTVATVGALHDGAWELPMHRSWHGKAFLR